MRRSSVVLAVLGVVFIAAAVVTRLVIVPLATKLPSDLDTTVHYVGKGTILNSQALAAGNVRGALARDVDMTIDRHVQVTSTNGNTAVVRDDSTLTAANQPIADNHVYALDRTTLTEASAPPGTAVEPHTGLTISLPYQPKADNSYSFYDPPTRTSTPLTFVGTDTRGGREVNHYTAEASGPVKNEALAKTLPVALPKALGLQLVPLLPAEVQQRLLAAADSLPEVIPLSYTARTTYDIYADATLGAPIESAIERTIVATATLPGQQPIPLLGVLELDLTQTPGSVQERADQAASNATLLNWLSVWIPVALLVIGVLLVVVAIIRRRPVAGRTSPPEDARRAASAPDRP